MPALLYSLLAWAMSGFLQNLLVGAGISLVTYTGLSILVEQALNAAVNSIKLADNELLQFALIFGLGEFISIVGSAVLTRVAIETAVGAFGLKKTGT